MIVELTGIISKRYLLELSQVKYFARYMRRKLQVCCISRIVFEYVFETLCSLYMLRRVEIGYTFQLT